MAQEVTKIIYKKIVYHKINISINLDKFNIPKFVKKNYNY